MKRAAVPLAVFVLSFLATRSAGELFLRYHGAKVAHWATHRIEIAHDEDQTLRLFSDAITDKKAKIRRGHCSATAIGPHALLTASHCESDFADIKVDGKPAHVDKIIYDDSDHSIYLMSGVTFPYAVRVASSPLQQGDDVYLYGNPAEHRDYLRRGYVAAVDNTRDCGTLIAVDINGFFGDSGSALFNEQGEVTSLISFIKTDTREDDQMKTMLALDLGFRQSDYDAAAKYGR